MKETLRFRPHMREWRTDELEIDATMLKLGAPLDGPRAMLADAPGTRHMHARVARKHACKQGGLMNALL